MTADGIPDSYRDAPRWSFGDSPALADALLALVLAGTKRATCESLAACEANIMPRAGEISVILDGAGKPACAIETTGVAVMRFTEVDQAFAFEEGEDDRTLASWRQAHRGYFERQGSYREDMQVVCERFKLLDVFERPESRR
ncbi:ASCH domain-containing protein [Phreatobacter stygius]|uniref:ASCH domain-containing protein n=1 Tax=Phreatobacter stygius TaxID=1940610 RepID=A0A4D7B2Q7_9HYPH|nr:ASCH domain-containing protein [Phreatobacter stygius]QCI64360.1 ASCH domain-containing protein [Phreatobacter stygius]